MRMNIYIYGHKDPFRLEVIPIKSGIERPSWALFKCGPFETDLLHSAVAAPVLGDLQGQLIVT